MIEAEMTNVVTTATMLQLDMMKAQRSLDGVSDCHDTFTARLENITSLLTSANQKTNQLMSETDALNQTNTGFLADISNLNDKTNRE